MDTSTAREVPMNLSILKLAEPIFAAQDINAQADGIRTSNASSASSTSNRNPLALSVELQHYQDLFSKLRFSYVEQVTKEKFLRAVTADEPELADGEEIVALGEKITEDKQGLGEKKAELRGMIHDLEAQGRELARRYHECEVQAVQLQSLPIEIENLQATISHLESTQEPQAENPDHRLPLQPTLALLSDRQQELASLDAQIEMLRASIPDKQREIRTLEDELGPLKMRKDNAVSNANEARKRRENGGIGDDVEERGRWLKSVDAGLRKMLEV